jgi:hypothetical protein
MAAYGALFVATIAIREPKKQQQLDIITMNASLLGLLVKGFQCSRIRN